MLNVYLQDGALLFCYHFLSIKKHVTCRPFDKIMAAESLYSYLCNMKLRKLKLSEVE